MPFLAAYSYRRMNTLMVHIHGLPNFWYLHRVQLTQAMYHRLEQFMVNKVDEGRTMLKYGHVIPMIFSSLGYCSESIIQHQ